MPIFVEIVTRDRELYHDQVDAVLLPGTDGQMGILEGHAPLLSTLEIGEIVIRKGDQTEYIAVSGGVVEVRPDKVTILAEAAEHFEEIDIERAEVARERARQLLESSPPPERRIEMVEALKKSTWRIRVAGRRRSAQRNPHLDQS
ncbi:MAG: F0F1 ATP synthase subunit epsilon [Caldilineaceae bacterium]|jgi:F-type H+-transporting ATPase subunit epsilon